MMLCCGCVIQKDGSEWGIVIPCTYHNSAPILAERDALRANAERWQHFASLPQTALMLGTNLDPNDTTVDWLVECNRLADAAIDADRAKVPK